MLNKLLAFSGKYAMIQPGDHVICAVSGGADSVALLFALYLSREKLGIRLSAAHFNHQLRGEESQRDEDFVRDFCARYDIPLYLGGCRVTPGEKGLEAAAREARYAFLCALPGKIATAHTADDNAETVLMHLLRGTGLKGLGGIMPVSGNVIRPMLTVTRQEVEAFLSEWGLQWMQDSSNDTDAFLRNRLRHSVLPILREENPQFSEHVSAMALRLRQDEDYLRHCAVLPEPRVSILRDMHPAIRSRALAEFLKQAGVPEPETAHIRLLEGIVFSDKPSASGNFPGGITVVRAYDLLTVAPEEENTDPVILPIPGTVRWRGCTVTCSIAREIINNANTFTLPMGEITLRSRRSGDTIRLPGGTKSLKKLFIDRKIPASQRQGVPVLADGQGVLAVYGIGSNPDRAAASLPAVQVRIDKEN